MAAVVLTAPVAVPAGNFGNERPADLGASPRPRRLTLRLLSDDWEAEEGLAVSFGIHLSENGAAFRPHAVAETVGGAVNVRTGELPSLFVTLAPNVRYRLLVRASVDRPSKSIGLGYELFGE